MMEYIERFELLRKAKAKQGDAFSAPMIIAEIENAPKEDVVEVVRCENCKWRNTLGCPFECKTDDGDYCSFSERKERAGNG